jgi:hypothetical protein
MNTPVYHKQCAKCKRFGYWKNECTPAVQMSASKCYNCGHFGHFASRCSNRQVFQQSRSLPDRTPPPPEPPVPPNPPPPPPLPPSWSRLEKYIPPPPPPPEIHHHCDPYDEPEEPAPDFNALLDETFEQEDAVRPLHSSMTVIDEEGFPLYQLPLASQADRNIILRMRTCTFCDLEHPENVDNCPFEYMQGQLDVLNEHNDSEDSMAISRSLGQAYYVIEARIMRRDNEEQWPLPQAGPFPQDMYDDTVSWVTSMEDTDVMYSSVTSGPLSITSSMSSLHEDEGLTSFFRLSQLLLWHKNQLLSLRINVAIVTRLDITHKIAPTGTPTIHFTLGLLLRSKSQ